MIHTYVLNPIQIFKKIIVSKYKRFKSNIFSDVDPNPRESAIWEIS